MIFERPLNKRGVRAAKFMGERLDLYKVGPDLILTSPAKRAFHTTQIIAEELGYSLENIVRENSIYDADMRTLLQVVGSIDDSVSSTMLFGHNPGMTMLANYLSDYRLENLPTCGIFCIQFNTDHWKEVANGEGIFQFFDFPKKHLLD